MTEEFNDLLNFHLLKTDELMAAIGERTKRMRSRYPTIPTEIGALRRFGVDALGLSLMLTELLVRQSDALAEATGAVNDAVQEKARE